MEAIPIIGIRRGDKYSPLHVGDDAAIFDKVAEELRRLGCKVDAYAEKDFVEQGVKGSVLFGMARSREAVARLKALEDEGALAINSAYGISNCARRPMTELLVKNGIPHPRSFVVPTAGRLAGDCCPCWVKRGDSHTIVAEDVAYAATKEEAEKILAGFRRRGIPVAVVNEHLQGDLVKFYGVRGTGFFYWFYPPAGPEGTNGEAEGFPFSAEELEAQSEKASEALGVPVYGGDCVVAADGTLRIIDFNDWPSFARCREEAGREIARYIYGRAKERMETGKP